MNISLLLFVLIIVSGLLFQSKGESDVTRKHYIILIVSLLTLESGLRGLSVGPDTYAYYEFFFTMQSTSWSDILRHFVERYVLWQGDFDVGFEFFTKFISLFTRNYSIYLIVCALTFFVPFAKLLYRYTSDIPQLIFIFIFYVALFHMIAMSGVRKEIALGFSILAFMSFVDKKYIQCIICVLLGALIHLSMLLFLLIPLLSLINFEGLRKIHLISFFFIPFVILNSGAIIVFMGESVGSEKYMDYGMHGSAGGAYTFTVMIELLSLFCYFAYANRCIDKEEIESKLYTTLPCFTFFAPLITNNGSMIRISQYFHIYILLILPYAINYVFPYYRSIVYVVLSVILIIMSQTSGTMEYYFIWQDNI